MQNYKALSRVYANKGVSQLPASPSPLAIQSICDFFLFLLFGDFLGIVSVLVGDGQDWHMVLPKALPRSLGSNVLA